LNIFLSSPYSSSEGDLFLIGAKKIKKNAFSKPSQTQKRMKTQAMLTTLPASAPSAHGSPRQENLNNDPAVTGFLAARDRLRQREQELEAELAGIHRILAGKVDDIPTLTPVPAPSVPPQAPETPAPKEPKRTNVGLRQAVIELITKHGPLTKQQIVEFLTDQKFPFFGKPRPALDPVLYSKKFAREGKLFRLVVAHE
jgi:hypothetical protein